MIKIILLLNPVYITLFWALVLTFENRKKQVPKLLLGRFMFVAFILYLSHFFYFSGQLDVYLHLDSIYTLASLLVYPLYHIYVRLLTVDRWFSLKTHGKYLMLPGLVFALHLAGFIIMDKPEAMFYLEEVLPGHMPGQGITSYMNFVYRVFRIVFVAQALFYLIVNFKLIFRHNQRIEDFYSNLEARKLNWVQLFNITLGFTSMASVAVAISGRDAFTENDLYLAIPSMVFSIMLFIIGFLGNIQGEVNPEADEREAEVNHFVDFKSSGNIEHVSGQNIGLTDNLPSGEKVPVLKSTDNHSVKTVSKFQNDESEHTIRVNPDNLKQRMERLFENEMIFRNPDLKIRDVSSILGTNRTYVSRLINSEYGRNFCNHFNNYRVEYAKKLITRNNQLTNEEAAELSGFGSVNSLYRSFKSIEKISLGEYRKN